MAKKKTDLGPKIIEERKDTYRVYINRLVDVTIQGNENKFGTYRGKNIEGDLVLQPCLIRESCPIKPDDTSGEIRTVLLWSKSPEYISHISVLDVSPVRRGYVDRRILETAYPKDHPLNQSRLD